MRSNVSMQIKSLAIAAAAALIVGLTSCASPTIPEPKLDLSDASAIAAAFSVEHDDFKKGTRIRGPNATSSVGDSVLIRGWKVDKDQHIDFQIYVAIYYIGKWRYFDSAYDSDGTRFEVTVISRDVHSCGVPGCSHTEHLGLRLPQTYLEQHRESGITFQVSGKLGDVVYTIPGPYVQAALNVGSSIQPVQRKNR